jgi:CHAT domain-containing protein
LILTGRLPEAQQVLTMIKETELFELLPQNADPRTTRVSLTPLETACSRNGDRLRAAIKRSLGAVSDSRRSAPLSKGRAIARQKLNQANARLVQWLHRLIADFGRVDERPSLPRRKRSPAKVGRSARPMRDVALLQYLLEPAHLRIIASVAGVQRRYEVTFAEGEINRLVFEMRSALHAGSLDYLGSARRLHDLLIAPVIGELGGVSTLALALDGVLRYLPVAALHDGRRFLLEDFALVLTTGAARGARRPKPKQRPAQAAGLGVSRRIGSHASLPGVQEELSSVIRTGPRASGILPGVIRLDEAFTADALRNDLAGGSGVIHIASHFVFRAAEEASSYLLLGDGSKLTLHDLARLRFDDVDLMVLSACDTGTGGGHRQSGREIEGLGAMARRRGARNVVATLWPVKDFTTAALMRAFYRNRYERGLEPAEALRRAQLSFLDGTIEAVARTRTRGFLPEAEDAPDGNSLHAAHPYHWAPYMLMGDAS